MPKDKKPIVEGYKPQIIEKKGYQPSKPGNIPTGDPKPKGGYTPSSSGNNPTKQPTTPGDE
jgi:hypothetical protein